MNNIPYGHKDNGELDIKTLHIGRIISKEKAQQLMDERWKERDDNAMGISLEEQNYLAIKKRRNEQ